MDANYKAMLELRNLRDESVEAKYEAEMEDDPAKKKEKEEEWQRKNDEYEREKAAFNCHAVVVKETADVIFANNALNITTFSLHPDLSIQQMQNPGLRTTANDIEDYINAHPGLELLDG